MSLLVNTYLLYLIFSGLLTIWVGHNLHRNGFPFLLEAFHEKHLAEAINNLLLIGFYLINISYVLIVLKEELIIVNIKEAIDLLSIKLGLIVTLLAVMHFFNLVFFTWWRTRRLLKEKISNVDFEITNNPFMS